MTTKIEQNLQEDLIFKNDLGRTASGDLERVGGEDNLFQAVFHRLITVPGSFAYRPNYGIGIKRYQNALNSLENRKEMMLLIQRQLAAEPRIEVVEEVSVTDEDDGRVAVKILVRPVGMDSLDMLFTPFDEGEI